MYYDGYDTIHNLGEVLLASPHLVCAHIVDEKPTFNVPNTTIERHTNPCQLFHDAVAKTLLFSGLLIPHKYNGRSISHGVRHWSSIRLQSDSVTSFV